MSVEFDDILKAIAVIKMKSKNLQKKIYGIRTLYIDLYIILYLNPRNSFQQNRIIIPIYIFFKNHVIPKKNLLVNYTPHVAKGYNVHL